MSIKSTGWVLMAVFASAAGCADPVATGATVLLPPLDANGSQDVELADCGSDCVTDVSESAPSCNGPDGPVSVGENLDACTVCGPQGTPIACPIYCDGSQQCVQVTRLRAGGDHSCVELSNGEAWCWGRRTEAQIGDGAFGVPPAPPTLLHWAGAFTPVTAGWYHTCVLLENGSTTCFGLNTHGQAGGDGDGDLAVLVSVDVDAAKLIAGARSTCAVATDGSLTCWGYALNGQLATGSDAESSPTPAVVSGFGPARPVSELALALQAGCALSSNDVWCFGASSNGELGSGDFESSGAPVKLSAFDGIQSPIMQLEAGRAHFCARSELGAVWCWGRNAEGQLGEHPDRVSSPIRLELPEPATDVALGSYHTCALGQSGALWCWGRTQNGVLGQQSEPILRSATRFDGFPANDPPVDVESGIVHSCAVLKSGDVRCWGSDASGQLGTTVAGADAVPTPTRIFFLPK